MKFALDIPITGEYSLENVVKLAIDAEKSGWDGFFLWDMLLDSQKPEINTLDPIVTLSLVASATKKMKIGLMLTAIVRRRPWKLARELITIDHLSQGRLIAGFGLGYNKEEFLRFGEEDDKKIRGEKLDEALKVITGLIEGETVNFSGKYFTIHDVKFNPYSFQKPRFPIWLGGFWPNKKPFRRAAIYDGMYPGIVNPDPNGPTDTMKPEDLQSIKNYLVKIRGNLNLFDLMHYGEISSDYSKEKDNLIEWEKAGLTWWAESNDFNSYREHRARILDGPPKSH